MPRIPLPFHVDDISALARAMGGQLAQFERPPSHLEILNMLARSAGCRNFQHWRALAARSPASAPEAVAFAARPGAPATGDAGSGSPAAEAFAWPAAGLAAEPGVGAAGAPVGAAGLAAADDAAGPAVDEQRVRRLARYFDEQGRLKHWPGKYSHREPCLWALWSALPAGQAMAEPDVNRRLQAVHLFGDHALLRRWLCDHGLLDRTPDCREYRRVERRPSAEAAALIRLLRPRRAA